MGWPPDNAALASAIASPVCPAKWRPKLLLKNSSIYCPGRHVTGSAINWRPIRQTPRRIDYRPGIITRKHCNRHRAQWLSRVTGYAVQIAINNFPPRDPPKSGRAPLADEFNTRQQAHYLAIALPIPVMAGAVMYAFITLHNDVSFRPMQCSTLILPDRSDSRMPLPGATNHRSTDTARNRPIHGKSSVHLTGTRAQLRYLSSNKRAANKPSSVIYPPPVTKGAER